MQGGPSDELLDAIYDPALRHGEWRPALANLRDALCSAEVAFTVVDSRSARPALWKTTESILSAAQCDKYQSEFMHVDPKMPILADRGRGHLFNDVDYFDERFVERDPFYQGYSLPLGVRHTLDLFVDTYNGRDIYLAAMRSPAQGPYAEISEDQLRCASRHFVRALKARDDLVCFETTARHASAALDRFEFGVAVVDVAAKLLFANAFAQTALAERTPFRLVGSAVSARARQEMVVERLRGAIAGRPSTFRLRDREEWLVSAIPLPAESPAAPLAAKSAMLVFRRRERLRLPGAEEIMSLYGLSPSEADIALGIAAGKALQSLATERRVKLSTVRWQLLAVLQKLGVRRQADVVRVLSAIQPVA